MRLFTTVAALRCYLHVCRSNNDEVQADNPANRMPGNLDWVRQEKLKKSSPLLVGTSGRTMINDDVSSSQSSVGLVPTMGALHAGHLSLIERARQENTTVVVSIFVNPLQFGPAEDYQRYPRQLDEDYKLCDQAGVDVIFAPTAGEMGVLSETVEAKTHQAPSHVNKPEATEAAPSHLTQVVPPLSMTSVLCGSRRPGHFQGVATIVTKLLNIVQPERAYFGQKDAQQLAILQKVVKDLNLPVSVIGCPTVREATGLAMSSRNQYLTAEQKQQATALYRSLSICEQAFKAGERHSAALITSAKTELSMAPEVQIEYVELVHPTTLMPLETVEELGMLAIAARVGSARLIDNVILRSRKPIVAIDGPAGAGKSTVARQIADELDLLYLDTGAMYRALTWLVLQSGTSLDDRCAIAELASTCQIQFVPNDDPQEPMQVWVNGQEVTQAIRSLDVTSQVSLIAAQPLVRQALVKQQQGWGQKGGLVAEGRDIGTHVFPDAELKIFLTASVQERARRRQQDFQQHGQLDLRLEQLEKDIAERDWKDSSRDVAPLKKAADAIEIQTDGKSVAEVKAEIIHCYHQRLPES